MRYCLLAALLLLAPHAFGAPAEPFPSDRLLTIHITISAEDFARLSPPGRDMPARGQLNPLRVLIDGIHAIMPEPRPVAPPAQLPARRGRFSYEYTYVPATVEIDAQRFTNVALRYKGNSSYAFMRSSIKKSFKLDLDRRTEQDYLGLRKLNLNNNAMDSTQLREALSYALFREAGLPASRTAFARVYVTVPGEFDREYFGLYTLVEQVDKRFLKQHFQSAKGILLKPQGTPGMPYYGERWDAYVRNYNPKSDVTPAQASRFIELTKLVNQADRATFNAKIRSYVDVDEVILYAALNSLVVNLDSYLQSGHNYYLYIDPSDNLLRIIPWDLNLAFAGLRRGNIRQAEIAIDPSWSPGNRLIQRLMEIPEVKAAYKKKMRELITSTFSPAHTTAAIQAMQKLIAPALEEEIKSDAATRPAFLERFRGPTRPVPWGTSDLKSFVSDRITAVERQLDGKDAGWNPYRGVSPPQRPRPAPARPAVPHPTTRPAAPHASASLISALGPAVDADA